MIQRSLPALLVAAGLACSTPTGPDPAFQIQPILIESVEVAILEIFPAQVDVHVRGVVGDGCSELLPVEQTRNGNEARISIQRRRPVDVVCIQIAILYQETIRLAGSFDPGDYRVVVNDTAVDFHVD